MKEIVSSDPEVDVAGIARMAHRHLEIGEMLLNVAIDLGWRPAAPAPPADGAYFETQCACGNWRHASAPVGGSETDPEAVVAAGQRARESSLLAFGEHLSTAHADSVEWHASNVSTKWVKVQNGGRP